LWSVELKAAQDQGRNSPNYSFNLDQEPKIRVLRILLPLF
jgi:hypothetical protein